MKYKLIVSDIDGVWTDGGFFYSSDGDVLRKFSTRDSYGVKLCQLMEIPVLVISTEENQMVEKRMEKLHVRFVKLGIRNKFRTLSRFCQSHNINLDEVAFIGDDMNDFHLIGKVGFFACPKDAYPKIREKADLVLRANGGEGAFREFVERLFTGADILEKAYQKYIEEALEK